MKEKGKGIVKLLEVLRMTSWRSPSKATVKPPAKKRPLVELPKLTESSSHENSDAYRKDFTHADFQEELLTRSRIAAAETVVKHISARIHFKNKAAASHAEMEADKIHSASKGFTVLPTIQSTAGGPPPNGCNTDSISHSLPGMPPPISPSSNTAGYPLSSFSGRVEESLSLHPFSVSCTQVGSGPNYNKNRVNGKNREMRCQGDLKSAVVSGSIPLQCANEPLEVVSEYLQQIVQDVFDQITAPISAAHYSRHVLLINEMLYREAVFGFTPSMILGGVAEIIWIMAERLMEGKLLVSPFHDDTPSIEKDSVFSTCISSVAPRISRGLPGDHRVARMENGSKPEVDGEVGNSSYAKNCSVLPLQNIAIPRQGVETYLPSHIQKPVALDQHNAEDGLPLHLPSPPPFCSPVYEGRIPQVGEARGSSMTDANPVYSTATGVHHAPPTSSVGFAPSPRRHTEGVENIDCLPISSPAMSDTLLFGECSGAAGPFGAAGGWRTEGKEPVMGTRNASTPRVASGSGVQLANTTSQVYARGSTGGPLLSSRGSSPQRLVPPHEMGDDGVSSKEESKVLFTTQDALLSLIQHCEIPLVCLTLDDQRLLAPALELLCEVLSRIIALVVSDPLTVKQNIVNGFPCLSDGMKIDIAKGKEEERKEKHSAIFPPNVSGAEGNTHLSPSVSTGAVCGVRSTTAVPCTARPQSSYSSALQGKSGDLGTPSGADGLAGAGGAKSCPLLEPTAQGSIPRIKNKDIHSSDISPVPCASPNSSSASSSFTAQSGSASLMRRAHRRGKVENKTQQFCSFPNSFSIDRSLGGLSVLKHEEMTKKIRLAALHAMEGILATYERRIDHHHWEEDIEQEGRRRMLEKKKEESAKGLNNNSKKHSKGKEGSLNSSFSSPTIPLESSVFPPLPKDAFHHHVDTISSFALNHLDLQKHEMSELLVTRWEALLDNVLTLPCPHMPDAPRMSSSVTDEENWDWENKDREMEDLSSKSHETSDSNMHHESERRNCHLKLSRQKVSKREGNAVATGSSGNEKSRTSLKRGRTPLLDSSRNVNPFTAEDAFLQQDTDSEEGDDDEEDILDEDLESSADGSAKLGDVPHWYERENTSLGGEKGVEQHLKKKNRSSEMPGVVSNSPSSFSTGASSVGPEAESSEGDLIRSVSTVPESTAAIISFPQRCEVGWGEEKQKKSSVSVDGDLGWHHALDQVYSSSQDIASGSTNSKNIIHPSLCPTPHSQKGVTAVGGASGESFMGEAGGKENLSHQKGKHKKAAPQLQGNLHRHRHQQSQKQRGTRERAGESSQKRNAPRADAPQKGGSKASCCLNKDDSHFRGVLSSDEEEEVASILHLFIQLFVLSEHTMAGRKSTKKKNKHSKSYLLVSHDNGEGFDDECEDEDVKKQGINELPVHPYVPVLLARTLARCAVGDYCCSICLDLFWMLITSAPEMTSRAILYDTPRIPPSEGDNKIEPIRSNHIPEEDMGGVERNGENRTFQPEDRLPDVQEGSVNDVTGTGEAHWSLRTASASENLFQVLINFFNASHRQDQREMRNDMVILLMAILRTNTTAMQALQNISVNVDCTGFLQQGHFSHGFSPNGSANWEASSASCLHIHSPLPVKDKSPNSIFSTVPTVPSNTSLHMSSCQGNSTSKETTVKEESSSSFLSSHIYSSPLQVPIPLSTIDAFSAISIVLFGLLCRPELEAAPHLFDFDASLHGTESQFPFSRGAKTYLFGRRISPKENGREEKDLFLMPQASKRGGLIGRKGVSSGTVSPVLQQNFSTTVRGGFMDSPCVTFATLNVLVPYALRFHGVSSTVLRRDNLELKRAGWQFLAAFCNWQAVHISHEKRTIELIQMTQKTNSAVAKSPVDSLNKPQSFPSQQAEGEELPLLKTGNKESEQPSSRNLEVLTEEEEENRDGTTSTVFPSLLKETCPLYAAVPRIKNSGSREKEGKGNLQPLKQIKTGGYDTTSSSVLFAPSCSLEQYNSSYFSNSCGVASEEEKELQQRKGSTKEVGSKQRLISKTGRTSESSVGPGCLASPSSLFQDVPNPATSGVSSLLADPLVDLQDSLAQLLQGHQAVYDSYLLVNLFQYGFLDVLMMYTNVNCENLVVLQWTTEEVLILQEESWRLIDALVRSAEHNRRRYGRCMGNPAVDIEALRRHRQPLWKINRYKELVDGAVGKENINNNPGTGIALEVSHRPSDLSDSLVHLEQAMDNPSIQPRDYYPADVFWMALDGVQCALTYLIHAPSNVEKVKFLVIALLASVSRCTDIEVQRSLVESASLIIPLIMELLDKLLFTVKTQFAPKALLHATTESNSLSQRSFPTAMSKLGVKEAGALTKGTSTWSTIPPGEKIQFLVLSCFSLLKNIGEASEMLNHSSTDNRTNEDQHNPILCNSPGEQGQGIGSKGEGKILHYSSTSEPPLGSSLAAVTLQKSPLTDVSEHSYSQYEENEVNFLNNSGTTSSQKDISSQNSIPRSICSASSSELRGTSPQVCPPSEHFYNSNGIFQLISWAEYILFPNPIKAQSLFIVALAQNPAAASTMSQPPLVENELLDNLDLIILLLSTIRSLVLRIKKNEQALLEVNGVAIMMDLIEALAIAADALPSTYTSSSPCILRDRTVEGCLPMGSKGKTLESIRQRAFHHGLQYALTVLSDLLLSCPDAIPRFFQWHSRFLLKPSEASIGAPLHECSTHNYLNGTQLLLALWSKVIIPSCAGMSCDGHQQHPKEEKNLRMGLQMLNMDFRRMYTIVLRQEYVRRLLRRRVAQRIKKMQATGCNKASTVSQEPVGTPSSTHAENFTSSSTFPHFSKDSLPVPSSNVSFSKLSPSNAIHSNYFKDVDCQPSVNVEACNPGSKSLENADNLLTSNSEVTHSSTANNISHHHSPGVGTYYKDSNANLEQFGDTTLSGSGEDEEDEELINSHLSSFLSVSELVNYYQYIYGVSGLLAVPGKCSEREVVSQMHLFLREGSAESAHTHENLLVKSIHATHSTALKVFSCFSAIRFEKVMEIPTSPQERAHLVAVAALPALLADELCVSMVEVAESSEALSREIGGGSGLAGSRGGKKNGSPEIKLEGSTSFIQPAQIDYSKAVPVQLTTPDRRCLSSLMEDVKIRSHELSQLFLIGKISESTRTRELYNRYLITRLKQPVGIASLWKEYNQFHGTSSDTAFEFIDATARAAVPPVSPLQGRRNTQVQTPSSMVFFSPTYGVNTPNSRVGPPFPVSRKSSDGNNILGDACPPAQLASSAAIHAELKEAEDLHHVRQDTYPQKVYEPSQGENLYICSLSSPSAAVDTVPRRRSPQPRDEQGEVDIKDIGGEMQIKKIQVNKDEACESEVNKKVIPHSRRKSGNSLIVTRKEVGKDEELEMENSNSHSHSNMMFFPVTTTPGSMGYNIALYNEHQRGNVNMIPASTLLQEKESMTSKEKAGVPGKEKNEKIVDSPLGGTIISGCENNENTESQVPWDQTARPPPPIIPQKNYSDGIQGKTADQFNCRSRAERVESPDPRSPLFSSGKNLVESKTGTMPQGIPASGETTVIIQVPGAENYSLHTKNHCIVPGTHPLSLSEAHASSNPLEPKYPPPIAALTTTDKINTRKMEERFPLRAQGSKKKELSNFNEDTMTSAKCPVSHQPLGLTSTGKSGDKNSATATNTLVVTWPERPKSSIAMKHHRKVEMIKNSLRIPAPYPTSGKDAEGKDCEHIIMASTTPSPASQLSCNAPFIKEKERSAIASYLAPANTIENQKLMQLGNISSAAAGNQNSSVGPYSLSDYSVGSYFTSLCTGSPTSFSLSQSKRPPHHLPPGRVAACSVKQRAQQIVDKVLKATNYAEPTLVRAFPLEASSELSSDDES